MCTVPPDLGALYLRRWDATANRSFAARAAI
jgi:hypothetical protein